MNRGLQTTLKCFSTRFTHVISSANHRLTLSHGKEKQFLKIYPLSFPRHPEIQIASWEAITKSSVAEGRFPGLSVFIQKQGLKCFCKSTGKLHHTFMVQDITLQPAYALLPAKSQCLWLSPGQTQSYYTGDFHSCCASRETKELSRPGTRKLLRLCCNNCDLWLRKTKNSACILTNAHTSHSQDTNRSILALLMQILII